MRWPTSPCCISAFANSIFGMPAENSATARVWPSGSANGNAGLLERDGRKPFQLLIDRVHGDTRAFQRRDPEGGLALVGTEDDDARHHVSHELYFSKAVVVF